MGEVSLLINGLYVKVPVGQTLLQAARQLDIDIPTLATAPISNPTASAASAWWKSVSGPTPGWLTPAPIPPKKV